MFAMICTDNLRYKKTKYYDSEYIVKGTLPSMSTLMSLRIMRERLKFSKYAG